MTEDKKIAVEKTTMREMFNKNMTALATQMGMMIAMVEQSTSKLDAALEDLKMRCGCDVCIKNVEETKHPECTGKCEGCNIKDCGCYGCKDCLKWVYYRWAERPTAEIGNFPIEVPENGEPEA